ncbi:MAG: cation:proton antiporter [Gemmatimonadetes bacterium]|nr:cation:proton antiporter [Gemmatimonadota bacterium]
MSIAVVIVFVGLLIFVAHLFAAVFQRTRVPDVLFLIVIGLVLGPLSGVVAPDDFGAVGPVFTTVTLVVMLFEAGIGLDVRQLARALTGTLVVSLVGFAASVVVVGAVGYGIFDLGLRRSILLGAILGGTSSAVVIPMIQQLRMGELARTILAMESAVTDVLCIVVALAFLEALKLGSLDAGVMVGRMVAAFVLATALGTAAGLLWSALLLRVREIKNSVFTTAAFAFVVYGMVEVLGYSGAIASLAFGVTLGNPEVFRVPALRRVLPREPVTLTDTEKAFFAEGVFLLKTFFFVYIGLSLVLRDVGLLAAGALITLLLFAARAPVVRLTAPRSLTIDDAAVCAVMAPKGLAAAVLASLPIQQGIAGGDIIQAVTYAVVLFSIVATSALVVLLERTGLRDIYRRGFLGFAPPEPAA